MLVLILSGRSIQDEVEGWAVNIKNVYNDYDLTLDPKRYSRKVVELRNELLKGKHFYLDDLVDFLPEKQSSNGEKISINNAKIYEYIEI